MTQHGELADRRFGAVSSQEAKDSDCWEFERGVRVPQIVGDPDMRSLLDVGAFQDIVTNKLEHNPELTLSSVAVLEQAIEHYLAHDDFED